jgi:hypothetical protein
MAAGLRWTRGDGERWVAAWRLSGKSRSAFAREQGIALHRLYYWSTDAATHAGAIPSQPEFVEVRSVADGANSGVSVLCGDGVEIKIVAGFDAEVLRSVVCTCPTNPFCIKPLIPLFSALRRIRSCVGREVKVSGGLRRGS